MHRIQIREVFEHARKFASEIHAYYAQCVGEETHERRRALYEYLAERYSSYARHIEDIQLRSSVKTLESTVEYSPDILLLSFKDYFIFGKERASSYEEIAQEVTQWNRHFLQLYREMRERAHLEDLKQIFKTLLELYIGQEQSLISTINEFREST